MKKILENLWNDYFAEAVGAIETDEERELSKKAIDLHEKVIKALTSEQNEALEMYADSLSDISAAYSKKAFFKGCEFAFSLIFELRI